MAELNISGYVFALILTGVAAAIVEFVLPDGAETRSHIKLICGLCITVALIKPISDGVNYIFSLADGDMEMPFIEDAATEDKEIYESIFEQGVVSVGALEVEKEAYRLLENNFGISASSCTVTASFMSNDDVLKLERITIALAKDQIAKDPHEIKKYIESIFMCECEVGVDFG